MPMGMADSVARKTRAALPVTSEMTRAAGEILPAGKIAAWEQLGAGRARGNRAGQGRAGESADSSGTVLPAGKMAGLDGGRETAAEEIRSSRSDSGAAMGSPKKSFPAGKMGLHVTVASGVLGSGVTTLPCAGTSQELAVAIFPAGKFSTIVQAQVGDRPRRGAPSLAFSGVRRGSEGVFLPAGKMGLVAARDADEALAAMGALPFIGKTEGLGHRIFPAGKTCRGRELAEKVAHSAVDGACGISRLEASKTAIRACDWPHFVSIAFYTRQPLARAGADGKDCAPLRRRLSLAAEEMSKGQPRAALLVRGAFRPWKGHMDAVRGKGRISA